MIKNDENGLGRISVETLALPDFVQSPSGTFTYSGKILVDYKRENDTEKDFLRLGVVDDDGSDFREIFAGVIPTKSKANGIRFMPYQDNKRVLLGDYVMECTPNIDCCEEVKVIPLEYPWGLHDDNRIFMAWSEIVISQDNEHICWTILLADGGAAVAIGKFERESEKYVIHEAQVISSERGFKNDPTKEGYIIPTVPLGGEVKQFVRGGTGLSLVGAGDGYLNDSVIQDLLTGELTQITHVPGYEETTILSPDEQLGIVMSTRTSEKTNFAILGLLPRPHAYLSAGNFPLIVYMYAVASVRLFRAGNIGPVIIDVNKSMTERNYMGVSLNDPEGKWVYLSPMSWHPSGKQAMWPEMMRGNYSNKRIRIARLLEYEPASTVPTQKTPGVIPYGRTCEAVFETPSKEVNAKIAGKHCGTLEYERNECGNMIRYLGYSDDGEVFYNGAETFLFSDQGTIFEADVEMTGKESGEMKCRIALTNASHKDMPELIFAEDENGLPQTRGYARYGDCTIYVDVMKPESDL